MWIELTHGYFTAIDDRDGHLHFLSYFETEQEAALVYNHWAQFFFGEYARLDALPVQIP